MHVILVIVGGTLLLGLFLLFGHLWGGTSSSFVTAAMAFIPVWLLVAIANLWVGVTHAGYSMREEFPILLVVFVVPALLAGVAIWYFSHS